MDLTVTPPRDGSEKLGGWSWLPRMFDKARAKYHGNPGTYSHPCPRDKRLLAELGLSAEEFKAIVDKCEADEELLAEVERVRMDKGV